MKLRGLILFALLLGINVPLAQAQTYEWDAGGLSIDLSPSGELNLSRWGGEAYINIDLGVNPNTISYSDGKATITYPSFTAELYLTSDYFEYMVVLPSRPSNPRVSFEVDSPGLTWYYQPPLTAEYTQPGWVVNATHAYNPQGELVAYRAPEIVGSYAVYYGLTGNQYKSGKFTHIYRPRVFDSVGAETWGIMTYSNGVLYIDLDSTWLKDKARVYPVYVDPSFGYTTVGGTNWGVANYIIACKFQAPADGTLTHVGFWWQQSGGPHNARLGVYTDNAGAPNTLHASTAEGQLTNAGVLELAVGGTPAISNGVNYWLAVTTDYGSVRYDAGAANQAYRVYDVYGALPDPITGGGAYTAYVVSIWANYTVGGGPTNYPRSATQGITVGSDADRWFQGLRGGAQTIGFTPDGERIYSAVRSPTQSITLTSTATRILVLSRAASQAINMLVEALGVKSGVTNFIRGASQAIHFTSNAMTDAIMLLIYVIDTLGRAVSGAHIGVWSPAGNLALSGYTNATGYIDVGIVAAGNYTIQATKSTYQPNTNIYTVNTIQTVTVLLELIEEVAMYSLTLIMFVSLAVGTLYAGTKAGQYNSILYLLSTMFWLAVIWVWSITFANSGYFGLVWVFIPPFLLSCLWALQTGVDSLFPSKRRRYE